MKRDYRNREILDSPDWREDFIFLAEMCHQGTGQYLFNCLPNAIAEVVAKTSFNPFGKELTAKEAAKWVDDHLVIEDTEVVGVVDGDHILWGRRD